MEWFAVFILAIVQALTEFLPVSSSGHLVLVDFFLGLGQNRGDYFMTVVLHFGTACSTLVVYGREIGSILAGVFKRSSDSLRFVFGIFLSMIPAALVGIFFDEQLERLFSGNVYLVGFALIFTGLFLWAAEGIPFTPKKKKSITPLDAIWMGIAQMIAILPGVSRSGATISTALMLGNKRDQAAAFSFIMVLPLIFGKISKDALAMDFTTVDTDRLTYAFFGFIVSFLVGIWSCKFMISLVKKSKLIYFSYWCLFIGVLTLVVRFYKD